MLYDFYKELLTEKQADAINLYYNQDLSLSEISEDLNITRQGVRDCIKRGERFLYELEQRMGLVDRFMKIQNSIKLVNDAISDVKRLNDQVLHSEELNEKINLIKAVIDDIIEKV